jgi:hypothetical protein
MYKELLQGEFGPLGHYADELFTAKTDFEFFRLIAESVVPLIRRSHVFEKFYFQCIKERDEHFKLRSELAAIVPIEMEQVFMALKKAIEGDIRINSTEVKQQVAAIDSIFNQKYTYMIPTYIDMAYESIKHLLQLLLEHGFIDIVTMYATVGYNAKKIAHIEVFTFAPTLIRLHELDEFSRHDVNCPMWIIWEKFVFIAWCWVTPFAFFKDKELRYDDYCSQQESSYLLMLHSGWLEINAIKKQSKSDSLFFKRNTYTNWLKSMLNIFMLEQQSVLVPEQEYFPKEKNDPGLYRVELRFDDIDYRLLVLDVQWSRDGIIDTYLICRFHDGSGVLSVVSGLLKEPVEKEVDVRSGRSGSINVHKCLRGIKGTIVARLFFAMVSTYVIKMRIKVIYDFNLFGTDLLELKTYIKSLEKMPHRYR